MTVSHYGDDECSVIVMYKMDLCDVMVVCREVEGEPEGHVPSKGRLPAVGDECGHSTDGDADICRH